MRIPETMRAMVLTGHGGLDKLQYREDWPVPKPGPGEVLVKVRARGLNNTDINTRIAWYAKNVTSGVTDNAGKSGIEADAATATWTGEPLTFPRIQGADGAGVDERRIGERVMIDPWLLGPGDYMNPRTSGYFGSECDGGFADYTRVRAENALAVTSTLSDAELATFPCVATTAENLVSRTGLRPGETAVIAGASVGVGTTAIQACRLRGARVIAIAAKSKADRLLALGAHAVVDRNEADLDAAIRAAAGGPVDVALDVVGGRMFAGMLGALRQGGRYSSSGAIAGPMVDFDLRQLIYKDLQFTGATIVPPGTMARVVRLIEQGLLKPLLAMTFPLRDLARAQEAFMAKGHVGNIVVTMD